MSIVAEKIASEALDLSAEERAFVAHQLISSLETERDSNVETEWLEVIDRRSREIVEGKVQCRPTNEVVREIRAKIHASRRKSS